MNRWRCEFRTKHFKAGRTFEREDVARQWQTETSAEQGLTTNMWKMLPDGSVEMQLKGNVTTVFDFADLQLLAGHPWCHNHGYVRSRSGGHMHRLVAKVPNGSEAEVDHIDRNPLNNRRSNLRLVDHKTNLRNTKKQKNNKSGHNGIFESAWYYVTFYENGKRRTVHVFFDPIKEESRSAARSSLEETCTGKVTKAGNTPSICVCRAWNVDVCSSSSDGIRKRLYFKDNDPVDRERVLRQAIVLREATQARCNSTNGKATQST